MSPAEAIAAATINGAWALRVAGRKGSIEPGKDADLVLGSRYLNGIRIINWPLSRLMLSQSAARYVQIVTGMLVLILAVIHIAQVLHTWPIQAATSIARIQGGCFPHFVVLLLVAEIHAMVGLYRILVKWSWVHRQKFTPYLVYATIFFVALGFVSLLFFYFRSIPKGIS
jgi:succinate dehydrogenase hydrophobic anchor subunit